MPLSGPHTYIETLNEYLGHWTSVNAALSPGAVTPNGYTIAQYETDIAELTDVMEELDQASTELTQKRDQRDNIMEGPMKERIRQFRFNVKGNYAATAYDNRALPDLPRLDGDMDEWRGSMNITHHIWTQLNAGAGADLLLVGGYTLANFTTDRTAMTTLLEEIEQDTSSVKRLLEQRDRLMDALVAHLQGYADAVQGAFAEGDEHILSIPRLWPLPGHTPDPVVLSGVWNAITSKFDLSWTVSEDSDLESYKVYGGLADAESVGTPSNFIATIPAGTEEYATTYGTSEPGMGATFKVYVVLDTGNEAGSNVVTIFVPPGVVPGP